MPRKMNRLAALLFCVAAQDCASADEPRACTALGCMNGFDLRFSPNAAWPAGAYRFELEADGVKQSCTGNVPFPACGSRALTCTGGQIAQIGESGCALPASDHGFSGLTFSGTPARIRVIVQREGRTLLDREFTPAYTTSRPNGPSCEPVCTNALDTAAVAF
jgi:hypothetical protein